VPSYPGKYQYLATSGTVLGEGACKITFEGEKFSLVPVSGAPITFDLAAVDKIRPAEWEVELDLYTEKRLLLRQFGAAFSRMCGELVSAWRDRTVAALLLEDLEEVARYEGAAALSGAPPEPAEIRIFKTNLAVLPKAGAPFHWRIADVDSIAFDEPAWAFQLARGNERLALSKFAKKTEEFGARLRAAFDELRQRSAEALRERFLFLDPDSLAQLADLMREGRSVAMGKLGEIDPRLPDAIVSRAVDAGLRPYFDWLRDRAGAGLVMTGFKFIRAGEDQPEPDAAPDERDAEAAQTDDKTEAESLFFWFFFPLRSANLVAWEAVTGSGRATYFFRLPPNCDIEEHVQRLTRALALINFRREPVYLPDQSLEEQPRFHRYAIAARKIPELRTLRANYIGRAIHSSFDAWKSQAEAIVSGGAERGSATQGRV
jgi:hypothetical protein